MRFIQCDLEVGLSDDEKAALVKKMTEVTHKAIGSAYGHINVVLREHPASNIGEARVADRGLLSARTPGGGARAKRAYRRPIRKKIGGAGSGYPARSEPAAYRRA